MAETRTETLVVQVKDQFGRDVVHPVNETARLFAQIAGTRTLTAKTVQLARQLGYAVELLGGELPPEFE